MENIFGKQDEMRGHMLEVELLTLDPKIFNNIQYFFTKYKDLLSKLKACGVDKSKEEKQMALTILSKLGPELSVFASTFHLVRFASGATWKIPSLEKFIESLTQEQTNLINMAKIKGPKAHGITVEYGSDHQYQKSKYKDKRKAHENPKKEGYSKPFNDASGSKGGKGRNEEKCTYYHKGFHLEFACMKKYIDLMTQILQQNKLGYRIPEGAKKKKPEDQNPKKGNYSHALIAINSSPDVWIIDLGTSHHMDATKAVYSSLDACKGPPILMGDNSPVEVTDKGRIELTNESFENVLHVPKLSVNILFMYRMKNSDTGKKFIFTPDAVDIYEMQTNSRISTSEVNHQSRLYTFSEFIEPYYALLLTRPDQSSRIWHERFGHLNFIYMQQLRKKGLVDVLLDIHFSKGICEGCVLVKHPQEKFDKGKTQRSSSPLDLIYSDLMGPFPHPSINKARYMLIFVEYFSRFTWIFFLKKKSEVFQHLKDFKSLVETQLGKKLKILRTGNKGEYVNHDIQNLCHEVGIQFQHIVPYTPQQNGVAERKNRSLKEMASFMLHAKSLPHMLWAEALNFSTYIQKISPHRYFKDKIPYEAWSGLKPEVTHFRIFSSHAWAQIPSEKEEGT
jgi:hypothetical protein